MNIYVGLKDGMFSIKPNDMLHVMLHIHTAGEEGDQIKKMELN